MMKGLRRALLVLAPLLGLALAGCSDSSPAAGLDASVDAHTGDGDLAADLSTDLPVPDVGPDLDPSIDTGPPDAGAEASPDGPTIWPPPPGSYDCTSLAKGPPKRTNKVPLGCIIDPTCSTMMVTAHRGAGVDSQKVLGLYVPLGKFAPENTLSAVRYAIVAGADVVEVDVRSTADGKLVLMHDDDVERTTQGKGPVSGMTLAQIQALKLKTAQFAGDFSCERVPTLDELLILVKGRINVDADLKTDASDQVALAVQQAGMLDQVFMSASSQTKLAKARAAVPQIRLQARTDKAAEIPVLLAAFTPPPAIMEIDEAILNAANIATIHAAGAKVFADGFTYDALGYMTNDPKSYQGIVAKNPDVIQVDRIDLLLELLGR
jgi:glycerophosphoryl diester phosphodiesterase